MQKKKGISLIVLVITIIVMIILAATIIVAINNNNVVDKAKDAVSETNLKQIQEMAQTLWADAYIEGARTQEKLEEAVTEGLKGTDTSKYIITVTTTGVEVSVKTEAPADPSEPVEPEEPTEPEGTGTVYATTFSDNTWSEIIAAVQNDEVPSTWEVGDTKVMAINGNEYNIQIIGKNHDTYSDGSGTAPLTFQLVELYGEKVQINSYSYNTSGWSGSAMRSTALPAILADMPLEVQNAIKAVNKSTLKNDESTLEVTSDKLFLLSEHEVFGTTKYTNGIADGTRYTYYLNGNSAIKTFDGSAIYWWLRTPRYTDSYGFATVSTTGALGYSNTHEKSGVAFGFCF